MKTGNRFKFKENGVQNRRLDTAILEYEEEIKSDMLRKGEIISLLKKSLSLLLETAKLEISKKE